MRPRRAVSLNPARSSDCRMTSSVSINCTAGSDPASSRRTKTTPPRPDFSAAGEWTSVDPLDWRLLLAVRFALLARSTQFEKTKVTPTAANPRWSGGAFTMRNIDGTADSDPGGTDGEPNNWRNYRYNVFEAVVPLRNNIFGRAL
jgi:hypothetical protein